MEITSFYFLCFYAVLLCLYYILPGRLQWVLLLSASILFYLLSGNGWLILWPAAAVAVTFLCTQRMKKAQESGQTRGKTAWLLLDVLLLIGVLAALKYLRFGGGIAVPLGLSFYTFILAGYAIDVYNGIAECQDNFFRLALYGFYFPTMISGPIQLYRESGAQLYEPHRFDYEQVTKGMQRMVWGFFKKLVISEYAAVPANTIFDNYTQYGGAYIWVGAVLFTIQLYADFSGCMDIVIGLSQTLGIKLPENFSTPFFSKSISEYWRRWHITLGIWMKDYVFYPLLRSGLFTRLGKANRERFGRKAGKQLTTFTAMFILWLSVGLWHGGNIKYVIGAGLLHWFYIVFGEVTLPFWKKFLPKLHIPMEGRAADTFRIVRTFFLVNIGNVFFRAESAGAAVHMLRRGISVWNPQILADGSLFGLGLDWIDFTVLLVSVAVLFTASVLQQKRPLRDRIAEKPGAVRWIIWFALLFYVILLGKYGPGYSTSEFIYQGF
ncbi:MAG: MBOAT family protein [Lachnospiraceae bacterium]|jgi:D-alanyl-lipoteichoic acid acyltransferase DltB (MBOAT superfamily)|nr:MBOAT family protein [Lachnospiraceae bacterium]